MGSKTIMVTEEAYDNLKRIKKPFESFTDVILRITPKQTLKDLAGAWKDIPDEEIKKMKQMLAEMRTRDNERLQEVMEQCISPTQHSS